MTDPPYGVELRSDVASGKRRQQEHGKDGQGAERPHRGLDSPAWKHCSTATSATFITEARRPASFRSRLRIPASTSAAQIIWSQGSNGDVFGQGDYHWQHEPCWYGVREGKKGRQNQGPNAGNGLADQLRERIPVTATERRSRWSAWRGQSGTTFARRFTNRSAARAQPSSRARTSSASAEPLRSIRATSPSLLNGSRRQPGRSQSWSNGD